MDTLRQHAQVETDLTLIDGLPSPAADEAYIKQKSDIVLKLSAEQVELHLTADGPAYSPFGVAGAYGVGAAPGLAMGLLIDYFGAPMWVSCATAFTVWLVIAAGITAALLLVSRRGNECPAAVRKARR